MKTFNFIMGLIMISAGVYTLYLAIAEQRRANRPNLATRIARVGVGFFAILGGVLAILTAMGVIFTSPRID